MTQLRIAVVAELCGVSTDTVRRWVDRGYLIAQRDQDNRISFEGTEVARFAKARLQNLIPSSSARNQFRGIVTDVKVDGIMAQVEIAAGIHRIVALVSRESIDQLGLQPGSLATALVKATNVVVTDGQVPA